MINIEESGKYETSTGRGYDIQMDEFYTTWSLYREDLGDEPSIALIARSNIPDEKTRNDTPTQN